ncbi:MAG TPA: hypothetical protein VMI06_13320 [Terriglobia bacterium]|nr:hypothetical protein [Terriglobia bacterium]
MRHRNAHLSDEDLLLLADGELASRRAVQAREHLTVCWDCRTRMGDLERAIADFVHMHRDTLDPQLPPAAGPRALLKARLAESVTILPPTPWYRVFESVFSRRIRSYVCAALLLVALGGWAGSYLTRRHSNHALAQLGPELLPNKSLTPGVAVLVNRERVCAAGDNDPSWMIPSSVQQQALSEYGVGKSEAGEYQLDYLIPPGLGGTGDLRNVWPEPYSSTVWNARAKDALESRLRELVCQGQLGLPEAQHDLATDWISAYKRYFHISKPPWNQLGWLWDAPGSANPKATDRPGKNSASSVPFFATASLTG